MSFHCIAQARYDGSLVSFGRLNRASGGEWALVFEGHGGLETVIEFDRVDLSGADISLIRDVRSAGLIRAAGIEHSPEEFGEVYEALAMVAEGEDPREVVV